MLYENKIKILPIFLVLMKRQLIADQVCTHRWWKRNSKQLLRLKICLIIFLILSASFQVTKLHIQDFFERCAKCLNSETVVASAFRVKDNLIDVAPWLMFFDRLINLWTATNPFTSNEWLRVIRLLHRLLHFAILLMQRSMNVKAHRVWMEVVRISLTITPVNVWMDSQEGIVRSVKNILILCLNVLSAVSEEKCLFCWKR